ncbi:hypothetical protein AAVH_39629 [Aphelenchoides avenae]|nr:hypothetical protein AAVH_39629 [Aphelenchus avenae]
MDELCGEFSDDALALVDIAGVEVKLLGGNALVASVVVDVIMSVLLETAGIVEVVSAGELELSVDVDDDKVLVEVNKYVVESIMVVV